MKGLGLILVFTLHSQGAGGETFYHTPGDNVNLPCNIRSSFSSCSNINWLFNTDVNSGTVTEVRSGKVDQSLERAARLNMDSKCSLIIINITAQDAGRYNCHSGDDNNYGGHEFLNILTIYPVGDPAKDGDVMLECTLWGHGANNNDSKDRLQWVDETGTVLLREAYSYGSPLTVKHHREGNRRYTCQFFERNSLKIEDHYTSGFTDPVSNKYIIIVAVMIAVVLLLVIIAAFFIKTRRRSRVPEDETNTNLQNPTHHYEELPFNPTYATVDHSKSKGSQKIKIKEEEDTVTYSVVRTKVDIEPSALYS